MPHVNFLFFVYTKHGSSSQCNFQEINIYVFASKVRKNQCIEMLQLYLNPKMRVYSEYETTNFTTIHYTACMACDCII